MSVEINFPFNDAINYTFDTNKIAVSSGNALLKLVNDSGNVFNQDFVNDTGFTYDNAKAEFSAGKVQSIDMTPANALLGANFNLGFDANFAVGSITHTKIGTPVITSGKLDCTGNLNNGLHYQVTNDAVATIKFKYTPNYSGNPPNNVDVVGITEPTGNNNKIFLTHSPSGDNFRVWLYDSAGVGIYVAQIIGGGGIGLVSGTEYELELAWDNVAGIIYFFIDGNLHGTKTPGAFTFNTNSALLHVGGGLTYMKADESFDDILYFNNVQHTADYAPGYSVPNYPFEESKIDLPNFTYSDLGNITEYSSLVSVQSGSGRFILNGEWWNGSAWVASNGTYDQANSIITINANLSTATKANTTTISIVFSNSLTIESVDDLTINYFGQEYAKDNPTIEINTNIYADKIDNMLETSVIPTNDNIKWVVKADTQWYYVNSGVLTPTAGNLYAEASPIGDWAAIWSSWDPLDAVNIRFKAFINSNDGSTTPLLDNLFVAYDFKGSPIDLVEKCIVWAYNLTPAGLPILDPVTACLSKEEAKYKTNIVIKNDLVTVTPDATGYWEMELVENENMDGAIKYDFIVGETKLRRSVPNLTSKNFWNLT